MPLIHLCFSSLPSLALMLCNGKVAMTLMKIANGLIRL